MTTNDKIPIGKISFIGPDYYEVIIRLKDDKPPKHIPGDIITLDMIEPYESIAVRKVADYLIHNCSPEFSEGDDWAFDDAKAIVDLVHEAEDADE